MNSAAWCCVLVMVSAAQAQHKLYTSMSHLRILWDSERAVVKQLEQIQKVSKDLTTVLDNYIKEFYDNNLDKYSPDLLENPINAYVLIRQVAVGWDHVTQSLQKVKELSEVMGNLTSRRTREMVPDEADVDGAVEALILLQDMYDLNTTSLINGRINSEFQHLDVPSNIPTLTVWDGVKLGLDAVNNKNYYSGINYLESAQHKFLSESIFTKPYFAEHSVTLDQLGNFIRTAKLMHDKVLQRKGPRSFGHITNLVPFDTSLSKKIKSKEFFNIPIYLGDDLFALESKDKYKQEKREALVVTSQYKKLCQGKSLRNVSDTSRLYSQYVHNNDPWLRIGPLKMTVYSLDPYIVRFNQLLSPRECQMIKDFMESRLHIPTGKVNPKSKKNDWTMKHAWPIEEDSPALEMLGLRIHAATGVRTESNVHSEPFMVGNYGMGGNYNVHADFSGTSNFFSKLGDRIATVMTYLSDVKAGGATVFPYLGITSWPEMGSALMWWNMLKSGGYDHYTKHGACPVLLGEKWIGNKWIGYNGQWDVLQCTTNFFEKIKSPVM